MKKKIITYKEIELSEELKQKCIEYLKNNTVTVYWDYRDKLSLEQVEKLMTSKEEYYNMQDEIWENSLDYICDLENELLKNMQNEFSELQEFEISALRDEFFNYISSDMNIEQLIRNTPSVRIRVVIHSNYEGIGWQDRDYGIIYKHDYIKALKRIFKNKIDWKSFNQELNNICSSVNQFIFYMKCDIESLIGIKEKFKKSITIPKNAWAGFFDSWNGSGSVLEVKLLEDITLKKQYGKTEYDSIDIVLDENNKYSVKEVYGLCNVPKCNIIVK